MKLSILKPNRCIFNKENNNLLKRKIKADNSAATLTLQTQLNSEQSIRNKFTNKINALLKEKEAFFKEINQKLQQRSKYQNLLSSLEIQQSLAEESYKSELESLTNTKLKLEKELLITQEKALTVV